MNDQITLGPIQIVSFSKIVFMKHVSNVHFYEYKWYLLYSPWLSLSRSLRVSLSPQITLGPIQIVFFSKIVFTKHVSNVHFYEYKWYLLYSPWLSLLRLLRVSLSPQITLGVQGFGSAFFFADPDPDPGGIRGRGLGVKEKMIFFEFFFTFQMILNNGCLKSEQKK